MTTYPVITTASPAIELNPTESPTWWLVGSKALLSVSFALTSVNVPPRREGDGTGLHYIAGGDIDTEAALKMVWIADDSIGGRSFVADDHPKGVGESFDGHFWGYSPERLVSMRFSSATSQAAISFTREGQSRWVMRYEMGTKPSAYWRIACGAVDASKAAEAALY